VRDATRTALALIAIVAAGLAARGLAAEVPGRLIARDGIRYARLGRAIAEGRGGEALRDDYPPGYPVVVAAAGRALGARSDLDFARAAVIASVLAGALTAVPAFALARRAGGSAAGLGAAALAATHARHIACSSDALSEPLFGFLVLASLAASFAAANGTRSETRDGLAALLAGTFGAAAFLVRPEGILTLAALPVVAGRRAGRLRRAAALLLPFGLLALPYIAYMSGRAGALVISQKKAPLGLLRAAAAEPARVLLAAAGNFGRAWEVGPLALGLGSAGAALALRRRDPAARRAAAVAGSAFAAFLAAQAIVRVDPRFGLILSLIVLPLGGVALAALAARARRPGAALATLIAALGAVSAPLAVHAARADRPHYLDCAREIAAEARRLGIERPRVAAYDPRIAFYAGAEAAPESAADADFRVIDQAPDAPPGGRPFPPPVGSRARSLLLYGPAGSALDKPPGAS
jgi:hypothetical protein